MEPLAVGVNVTEIVHGVAAARVDPHVVPPPVIE